MPQRKARFYEAFSRLRLADGRIIEAKDFLAPARAAGLLPVIDHRVIQRCVQVVRRLAAKNREAGLFINISAETLRDGKASTPFLKFGDTVRIDITDAAGKSLFGAIEQTVTKAS